jgi:hypothetical protein
VLSSRHSIASPPLQAPPPRHTSAYVSIRSSHSPPLQAPPPRRTSAYVSIRQHASAHVSIRQHTSAYVSIRQHTSAYVSIRQHTSAYVIIRQLTSAYVSIRQHTSAYVSIRQHTSAYAVATRRRCKLHHLFVRLSLRLINTSIKSQVVVHIFFFKFYDSINLLICSCNTLLLIPSHASVRLTHERSQLLHDAPD